MLKKEDFSADARMARIAANKMALEALKVSGDAAAVAQSEAMMATPIGQGLPSTNEHPHGWTDNSWDDPAFANWTLDANGLMQPPETYTPPALPPAASDAWRNAAPGTIVTMEGVSYVVEESPFGNFIRKIKAPPAPVVALTVTEERAANARYAQGILSATDDENVQASWMAYLGWLSKR